jgi:hypothetical protein
LQASRLPLLLLEIMLSEEIIDCLALTDDIAALICAGHLARA